MWALPKYGKIVILILFCLAVAWYVNSCSDASDGSEGASADAFMGKSVRIDESKNTVREIPTKSDYIDKLIDDIQGMQRSALALAE
jgi:hypothetical protein